MASATEPTDKKEYRAGAWHLAALIAGNVALALGPGDDHAGGVGRGAAVGGAGRAGDEELLLGVAERLELVPGVPHRPALDARGRQAQGGERDPRRTPDTLRCPARPRSGDGRRRGRTCEQDEGQQADEQSAEHAASPSHV